MPYYVRPDGTAEIELPNGQRVPTAKTPEELQAMNIYPAQMSGGATPMSQQPQDVAGTTYLPSTSQQLDAIPGQRPYAPSPAVQDVQRRIDAQRTPTARFPDQEDDMWRRRYAEAEGGSSPGEARSSREGGTSVDFSDDIRDPWAGKRQSKREGGTSVDYEKPPRDREFLRNRIRELQDEIASLKQEMAKEA